MVLFRHGNFMIGSPDSSINHNNIMSKTSGIDINCKGCKDQGLQAYYSRSSGSTCPCVGNDVSYTNWFPSGNCTNC